MELWIPITIAAAFGQNLRSALQKKLKEELSTWGATSARFLFAAPFALVAAAMIILESGHGMPKIGLATLGYVVVGGIAQVVATGLLIHLFSSKNFTVATAYTKTEPMQTAVFGVVLLGDALSPQFAVAIIVSLLGVILISVPRSELRIRGLFNKAAVMGLLSGGLFGFSAVAYRGASLSLESGDTLFRASNVLALVTIIQSAIALLFLWLREPIQIHMLVKRWRLSSLIGLISMLGSLAWFSAFTMQNAALIRAVGQIEVIFMLGTSMFVFKERVTAREIAGVCLVSLGILALFLFGEYR